MPNIYGQLLNAQMENSVGDPSSGGTSIGRTYLDITSTAFAVPKFYNGSSYIPFGAPAMTSNTTGTATFNLVGNSETIYNTSASTLSTLTLTLPAATTIGQICRYVTNGVVTTLTVTAGGSIVIGAAVTTLAAKAVVAWQAVNTTGSFIRIS